MLCNVEGYKTLYDTIQLQGEQTNDSANKEDYNMSTAKGMLEPPALTKQVSLTKHDDELTQQHHVSASPPRFVIRV